MRGKGANKKGSGKETELLCMRVLCGDDGLQMTAAAEGQLEVVQLLLDRGADASIEDKDGDTATVRPESGRNVQE